MLADMLTYLLINFLVTLLSIFFSVLPTVTSLPFGVDTGLVTIYSLYHSAVRIFPFLGIMIGYILLALSIEVGYWLFRVGVFIINVIRGAGATL